MPFVELRTHSAFSFGDGTASPEALVSRAAELGYQALGLTDTTDLGGIIRFTLEAERVGIKPICGAELKVDGYVTAFLACDQTGYRNLAHLVTKARVGSLNSWDPERPNPRKFGTRGQNLQKRYAVPLPDRGKPGISFEDIVEHSEGVFCLTGPGSGELATLLSTGRKVEAAYELDRWRAVFGHRLAIEVQLHHAGGHEAALATSLIEIAERNRVTWFATNDPRSLDTSGRLVHDLLTANRADVCVNTAAAWGLLLPNGEWRLKSPREMRALWQ
ncbi:MAG TPA: PHP domain-containing protein, partial [Longimicrobiales bacterium]